MIEGRPSFRPVQASGASIRPGGVASFRALRVGGIALTGVTLACVRFFIVQIGTGQRTGVVAHRVCQRFGGVGSGGGTGMLHRPEVDPDRAPYRQQ